MKFLLNHVSSLSALKQWAGGHRLIVANHFFWSTGTPVQNLMPQLCPARWASGPFTEQPLDPWDRTEVCDTLLALSRTPANEPPPAAHSRRICIFFDGLDDYRDDHRELLGLLFKVSRSPHFKICASSRPWIQFHQALQQTEWTLAVQDLTRDDSRRHVPLGIARRPLAAQGARQRRRLPRPAQPPRETPFRSGCLPNFTLMLDTIDTVYRQRPARILKSLTDATTPLPVLLFHFFDLEEEDADYATGKSLQPVPESRVLATVKPRWYQLIAQCKDLVKLNCDPHEPGMLRDRVSFLHRTVSDLFRTESMDSLLNARVGVGFELRLTLSRGFLAMLRLIPQWWVTSGVIKMDRVRRFTLRILVYARELEEFEINAQIYPVLDCLDEALALTLGDDGGTLE
ncbi:hypothetical protein B0J18DRAFT_491820 [Chaetomium sp. MPI-SDFR-AT-0129]|nr:hypothetical protein B0J18DRAFT_491820 [Chaetomium sp. MPI-SDFR-AT-0129]